MASLQAFVPNAVGAPPVLVLSPDSEPMRLDSLCVACMKNGVTTLLMTKIPFFREVVLMSFDCQHCGFRSSEVQMGGLIPDRGVHFELRVEKGDVRVRAQDEPPGPPANASPRSLSLARWSRATRAPAGCEKATCARPGGPALTRLRRALLRFRSWTWRYRRTRSGAP